MAGVLRVLYVDDEPGLLSIGKLFLEREGEFAVDTLTSARDALEQLSTRRYDAIVSDYQMPGMDGITFLKQLKASGNTTPFIIFTGKGREEVVIEALNEGADFYLQKGGEPKAQFAELSNKIRYAVTRKHAEVELSESQKRTADIIEFLPDATFAISIDGVVIAWNRAMEAMTGIVKDEVLNKGNYEYSLPFYGERRPILVDFVLEPDETIAEKYPFIRKDGDKIISEILIPHFHDGKGAYLWFTASPLYDSLGNISGAIESIRDVTLQKHAEEELRRKNDELNASYEQIAASEEALRANLYELTRQEQTLRERETQLRATLESTADGILAVDNSGKILLVSRRFAEIWRIPDTLMEQGQDSVLLDFVVDQVTDPDAFLNKVQSLYGSDDVDKDILTFKDGRVIERHSFPMMMDGARIGRVWSFRDITGRKRAEDALRESGNQLDAMAANIPGVVYRFYVNPDGTTGFNYISGRSRQVLGIESDPVTFFDQVTEGIVPEDRERFLSSVQHAISTKTPWEFDGGYVRPSGKKIWISALSSPLIEGDRLIFDGVIFDNTGRKQSEKALRESEERHRSIVEALPGFLFQISANGRFIDFQADKPELLPLQPGEVIGKRLAEVLPPDLADLTDRKLKVTLDSGQLQIYEYSLTLHDQEHFFESRMIPGGADTVWAFVQDITGRKQADASLVKSEEQSRMLLSQMPDIVMVHQDGIVVYANQTAVDKTGFFREELIGSHLFDYVVPDAREIITRNMARRTAGEQVGDYEVDMVHKSGALSHVIIRTSPIVFNQVPSVVMILIDITERKQVEEALKESENLYRTIFETTGAATIIINNDTTINRANAGFAALSGFSIGELEEKKSWTEFVVPEDLEQMKQFHQDRRNNPAGEARVYEFRFINRYGEIRYCINNVSVIPGTTRSVASVVDITEWKLSEESLRESGEKFRNIFENSMMGLFKTAPDGRLINANNTFARMYGYSSAEEIQKSGVNVVQFYANPEDRKEVVHILAETGVVENYETPNLKRDGTRFWVSIMARAIRDADGTVLFYEGSNIDITKRKLVEEALAGSEEKYQTVADFTYDWEFWIAPDGKFIYVSPSCERITGYLPEEFMRDPDLLVTISHEDDRDKVIGHLSQKEGSVGEKGALEFRIIAKSGEERWIGHECQPVYGPDGEYRGNRGSNRDITERKRGEEKLVAMLKRTRDQQAALASISLSPHLLSGDVKSLSAGLTEVSSGVLGMERASVWLFNDKGDELRCIDLYEASFDRHSYEGVLKRHEYENEFDALSTAKYIDAHDPLTDPRTAGYVEGYLIPNRITSMLDAVIRVSGHELGVLCFEHVDHPHQWESDEIAFACQLADQLAITLLNRDRQLLEESLRKSEERYHNVVEDQTEFICRFLPDGTHIFINGAYCRYFDKKREEIIGHRFRPVIHPEDRAIVARHIASLTPGHPHESIDQRIIMPDGSTRWQRWSDRAIFDQNGKVVEYQSVGRDITEHKELENEREYYTQELRQLSASLTAANRKLLLLSGITRHDINNQLTIMRGYISVLEEHQSDPALSEYFQKVNAAAQQISAMIQFTREYEAIGVKAVTWQDCCTLVDTAAKEAPLGQVMVKNDLPAGAEVFADPLIVRVFYNLVDNATRYGGKITTVRFSALESGDDHVIVCEDDGGGVPPEEKEKIFNPGFGKNTGLGLFLSREILSITGITIRETGEPGKGARFEMTVPKGMWRIVDTTSTVTSQG